MVVWECSRATVYNAPTRWGDGQHAIDTVPSLGAASPREQAVVSGARALAKAPHQRFASLQEWRAAIAPGVSFTPSGNSAPFPAIDKPAPTFTTPLLGRAEALAAAAKLLSDGNRLVSVTGYGGTGKTRFASALQYAVADQYPGGTAFVSLAAVTDPREVMTTIATALDISEAHGRGPIDAVATLIGNRRVLLVLDNLEQVVESGGDISALLARCPELHVLATSRRPLRIGSETELPLPPLDLPESNSSVAAMLECPSVLLFVQRADVGPASRSRHRCARIAGSVAPFPSLVTDSAGLELAAARVRVLEPAGLLQRLDHALDLLTSGDRDLPLRQRTLRATISWSYSLLTAEEQLLLRKLSVFHEGWTLEALERVCYSDAERWRALDDLASLVEKGLVRVARRVNATGCWRPLRLRRGAVACRW